MSEVTNESTQNDIAGELSVKYTRLIAIQNELKSVFDYKWIKVVGVLAKQFKIDHPDTPMPYDIDKMQEKCDALRKEYDEIRKELAPYYPELREENMNTKLTQKNAQTKEELDTIDLQLTMKDFGQENNE